MRLDIRGLSCPFTLLEVSKAARHLEQDQVLEILVDSSESASELTAFLHAIGFDVTKESFLDNMGGQSESTADEVILIKATRRQG